MSYSCTFSSNGLRHLASRTRPRYSLLPQEATTLIQLEFGQVQEETKWYLMWDLLFRGHPRPHSPYVTTGIPGFLSHIGKFIGLQEKLPSLLRSWGVDLGSEAAASLAADIHGMYFNTPLAAITRRRLQYRNQSEPDAVVETAHSPSQRMDLDSLGPHE